jgi:chromodomain-helicase-DNA-binding protein 4
LVKKIDPYGPLVHPLSQPPLEDSSESSGVEYASEGSEELDQLEESESDLDEFVPSTRVRLTRSAARLPFSPAKASAKRGIRRRVQASDSDDEVVTTRRSARSTRNTKSYRDDDEYEEEGLDESDGAPSAPKKKRARTKASRPAYGHFREIADLELDDQSDDETLPLRAHRGECEKCQRPPSHILMKKLDRQRKNKRSSESNEEDEDEDERDRLETLGGWVRWWVSRSPWFFKFSELPVCSLKCPVVMHWKCINMDQRSEIRKAALERDMEEFERMYPVNPDGTRPEGARKPSRREGLDPYETTEFICNACMKGGSCIGCGEVALEPDPRLKSQDSKNVDGDVAMEETQPRQELEIPKELFFRCITCKRLSHYEHLPPPDHSDGSEWDAVSLAKHYSEDWLCGDCASFTYKVEKIIAWRPSPEGATQEDKPNYRDALPREYLIKWKDRSYRRVTWVPHMWILATHAQMLRHFILGTGSRVTLMERPVLEETQDPEPTAPIGDTRDSAPPVTFGDVIEDAPLPSENDGPAEAMPDAHLRIPPAWKTVDRVLDILLWRPQEGSDDEALEHQRKIAFELGEQPSDDYVLDLDSWERKNKRGITGKDIRHVAYAFFKWNDLGYEDCKRVVVGVASS